MGDTPKVGKAPRLRQAGDSWASFSTFLCSFAAPFLQEGFAWD